MRTKRPQPRKQLRLFRISLRGNPQYVANIHAMSLLKPDRGNRYFSSTAILSAGWSLSFCSVCVAAPEM